MISIPPRNTSPHQDSTSTVPNGAPRRRHSCPQHHRHGEHSSTPWIYLGAWGRESTSDVWVIPLVAFSQEWGRAGRDGEVATCVLLYAYSDKGRVESMLRRGSAYIYI